MILTIPTLAAQAATPDEEMLRLSLAVLQEVEPKRRAMFRVQLARCFFNVGAWDDGEHELELANRESPKNPYVMRGLGLARFRNGHIATGLHLYDAGRWDLPSFDKFKRPYAFRTWQGQNLEGRSILVWAEQGVGDQVMYARVLKDLQRTGARITVECEPRLIPLFQRRYPEIKFHTQTVPLVPELKRGGFDFQTSMFSAWRWAGRPGYQHAAILADQQSVRRFQKTWADKDGDGRKALNVGLSWASRAAATGARRSLSLAMLEIIARTGGRKLRFHNLQYGEADGRALSQQLGAPIHVDAAGDPLKNLDRQCAQIAALDLVITIDNATAHLAGALDVPCWVMVPRGSEFRWGKIEQHTNLYRSVRMFRARDNDSWGCTVLRVADALDTYLAKRPDIR